MVNGDDFGGLLSVSEIDARISELCEHISEIDVQLAFYKAGETLGRNDAWRARAIFAKTRIQREIRDFRMARREALAADAAAKMAADEEAKQNRIRLDAQRKEASKDKWRRKFAALQDWVWENFPDSREALIAETKRINND